MPHPGQIAPKDKNSSVKNYNASPTARLFHNSRVPFRFEMGPVGCGKSVSCVMDLLMNAMQQEPNKDGVRQTRFCTIRSSYPELKSTTIKTFQEWVPETVCPLVYDIPIRGAFKKQLADGTRMEAEFYFLALESEQDVKKLLSLELTGAWINEVREIPKPIFEALRGRIDRYPRVNEDGSGGATRPMIICDTNPPKIGHWIHELFESESGLPEGFEIFKYPPAVYYDNSTAKWEVNPAAENLQYLKDTYYKNQIAGNSETYIRVMLAGEYGVALHGKPVFPNFSQRVHVAKSVIQPDRGLPLLISLDFGLNPAATFNQLSRRGKLCIVDELAPADEDLESFFTNYIIPLVSEKYQGFQIQVTGDPAGRGRSGLDKRSAFDVCAAFNFRLTPAVTNNFPQRKEAVDYFLNRNEGLMVSPHCNYIIEGFAGGYVYEKAKNTIAGDVRTKEKAEKNSYSHGMDTVQYTALHILKGGATKQVKKMLNGMGNDIQQKKPFLWA